MPGRNAWCQRNIAERLTFSSFTTLRDDLWAADKPRAYAIVALPGYSIPEGIDRSSVDSMWLDAAPKERLVVWDGFCPHALFEVIYECFGFTPGRVDGKIGVFELQGDEVGAEVRETRAPEILALRPRKAKGLTRTGRENHLAELFAWSCLFDVKNGGVKPFLKGGGRATKSLYSDFFTYTPRDLKMGPRGSKQTTDSSKRETLWSKSADLKPMRDLSALRRGRGSSTVSGGDEVARYVGDDVREEMWRKAEKSLAIVQSSSKPTSLYEALLPRSRDCRTGLIRGSEEAAREDFAKTLGRADQDPSGAASQAMCNDAVDQKAPAAIQSKSWLGRIMEGARKKSQGF